MYRKSWVVGLCGSAMLALAASAAQAEALVWTGCGISKNAFMADVAEAYKAKTGVDILLTGGGATKGIRSVAAGRNQLGGACRHRLRAKSGELASEEADARLTQVAWDAIVAIVHPENPVKNITTAQLKGVFAGEIRNWKELGGPDLEIALIVREGKESGVGHMFRLMVMEDADYDFPAYAQREKSTGPVESAVESNKAALAVDGISSAKKRKVKFLELDGIAPSKSNIAAGFYPLFRPLYIVTDDINHSQDAQDFVKFVLSNEGQDVIAKSGTVNLAEGKPLEPKWASKKTKLGL